MASHDRDRDEEDQRDLHGVEPDDDTPDAIQEFCNTNGIGEKFQVILKEFPEGSSKGGVLRHFSNRYPTIQEVGEQWGPGEYEWLFSWKAPGPSGNKEPKSKAMRMELPERAWAEIHEDYLEKRRKERVEKKRKEFETRKMEAEITGKPAPDSPGADPLKNIFDALETLKRLGVPIGVTPNQPQGNRDWIATLAALTPAIAALVPVLTALLNTRAATQKDALSSQQTLLTTLLPLILQNKPAGDNEYMKQILGMAMGAMKQAIDFREMMKPEEKESFMDKMFSLVQNSFPQIVDMMKMTADQREKSFAYQMAMKHPDMQAAKSDPEIMLGMVNRLDQFYGFQVTNQILDVIKAQRPPETAANEAKFPSTGYEKKAETEGQEPTQDDTIPV